jgi:hypothetical protein
MEKLTKRLSIDEININNLKELGCEDGGLDLTALRIIQRSGNRLSNKSSVTIRGGDCRRRNRSTTEQCTRYL